jgi:hypothetical protein
MSENENGNGNGISDAPFTLQQEQPHTASASNLNPFPGSAGGEDGLIPARAGRHVQAGGARSVQVTIVIILLALILVVNIAALALGYLVPTMNRTVFDSSMGPQGSTSFEPSFAPGAGETQSTNP